MKNILGDYFKLNDIELVQVYDKSEDIFERLDKYKINEDAIFVTIKAFDILEFGKPTNFNSNPIQLALKRLGRSNIDYQTELPYYFEASQHNNKSGQYIDLISKRIDRNEAIAICKKMVRMHETIYDANLRTIKC